MAARRQVIVWSWSLQTGPFAGDDDQALLSDDERARQQSFVSPELRRRFLAARAGLRTLLGRHLDRDPRSLAFATNEFGKPRLAGDGQVHSNLSHSEERAALAISDGAEVGIDLEGERPIEHVDLARRFFHPNEVTAITASRDEAEQPQARAFSHKSFAVPPLPKIDASKIAKKSMSSGASGLFFPRFLHS